MFYTREIEHKTCPFGGTSKMSIVAQARFCRELLSRPGKGLAW